jgi:hypothetical protein
LKLSAGRAEARAEAGVTEAEAAQAGTPTATRPAAAATIVTAAGHRLPLT